MQRVLVLLLVALTIFAFSGGLLPRYAQDGPAEERRRPVVFMTDFGVVDDSVALCKGVMYSIAPDLRIVDLTHQVTPFSILDGARILYGATSYFPEGTVFVVVIDPGGGKHAQGGGGEVQARAVLCAAGQWIDDAGRGSR